MIEQAIIFVEGQTIEPGDVITSKPNHAQPANAIQGNKSLDQLLEAYEKSMLEQALAQSEGVKSKAARLLGITFRSFRYRLKKLGLDNED